MIHRKVLEHTGCTSDRLRAIFTAEDGEDAKIRKRFENRIASRISGGVTHCAKNSTIWQAVDLAWDSTPIQKQTIPLLLWAQGKIEMPGLIKQLTDLKISQEFIKPVEVKDKDGKVTGTEIKLDIPRLYEMSINLVRSYVTRRLAAQTTRFSNLWPYYRFESRGSDLVSKLRGDALSERVDVMANQYNYRHFGPQTIRHQFMYARSVVFPRCGWDKVTGWRAKDVTKAVGDLELESYVEREGVDFVAPHVSRVFYDRSAPLPNINTDNGPTYIGYWDIPTYRTIRDGDFWNKESISVGSELTDLITDQSSFFTQYFDSCVLDWPAMKLDPTAKNDRLRNYGTYAATDLDKGCLCTQYFEKVNPKRECISEKLNVDVWMRLTVAGDNTVIGGEFLTSLPACYGGLNENDDREVNVSMATELMGFQDQLTNIFSQMLMNIRTGLLQIWAIDKDALDPEMIEWIKTTMKAKDYYVEPQAFFYSGEKLRSIGVQNPADNAKAFLTIIQANVQTTIETSMKAAAQVLDMADRVLMMSPNETAQPNPREVAAREITEISTSTDAIKTFVSDGIDEQRAAMKRLIFESLVSESNQNVKVLVMDRYTARTIRDAGFEPEGEWADADVIPLKTPITGKVHNLIFDYYYDSRDGGDRPVNSQGAGIMGTMLAQFMQIKPVMAAFGKKRLFEWVNEIARMSGASIDLKLEMADGEEDDIDSPDMEERMKKVESAVQQIVQMLQQAQGGGAPAPGALPAPGGAAPPPPPGEPMPDSESPTPGPDAQQGPPPEATPNALMAA